jgi:hypothetical protein
LKPADATSILDEVLAAFVPNGASDSIKKDYSNINKAHAEKFYKNCPFADFKKILIIEKVSANFFNG